MLNNVSKLVSAMFVAKLFNNERLAEPPQYVNAYLLSLCAPAIDTALKSGAVLLGFKRWKELKKGTQR
jgi:hypothetical protein